MNVPFVIKGMCLCLSVFLVYIFVTMWRKTRSQEVRILMVFALAYAVGETLQHWHIGPSFVRNHMSDVGIVPSAGVIAFFSRSTLFGQNDSALRMLSVGLIVSFVALIAVAAFETVQFQIGRGDWIDMICYLVGFSAVLLTFGKLWLVLYKGEKAREFLKELEASKARKARVGRKPRKKRR